MAPLVPESHLRDLSDPRAANLRIAGSALGLFLLNILVLHPTTQDTPSSPSSPISTWLGSGWLRGLLEPERVLTGGWERVAYLLGSLVLLSLFFRGMRLLDDALGNEARAKSRSELGVKGEEAFREKLLEQAREGVELNMDDLLGSTRDIWREQGVEFVFVDHRAISPNLFASRLWLLFFATFAGFFLAQITSLPPLLHPLLALASPSVLLYLDYAHLESCPDLVSGVRPRDLLVAYLFSHPAALHELPRAHYPVVDAPVELLRFADETWSVLIDGFEALGRASWDLLSRRWRAPSGVAVQTPQTDVEVGRAGAGPAIERAPSQPTPSSSRFPPSPINRQAASSASMIAPLPTSTTAASLALSSASSVSASHPPAPQRETTTPQVTPPPTPTNPAPAALSRRSSATPLSPGSSPPFPLQTPRPPALLPTTVPQSEPAAGTTPSAPLAAPDPSGSRTQSPSLNPTSSPSAFHPPTTDLPPPTGISSGAGSVEAGAGTSASGTTTERSQSSRSGPSEARRRGGLRRLASGLTDKLGKKKDA